MATVISNSLVISQKDLRSPNNPRLCWKNIITPTSVTATSQQPLQPVQNLANSSTSFAWQATSTSQQDIVISTGQNVDYVGIARHNLDQTAEYRLNIVVDGATFTLVPWSNVPPRQALLLLFNEAAPDQIVLSIRNNPEPPRIAVLYTGLSTVLQRRIYVGHTPITYGRNLSVVGGMSESGQYLGELIRRESRSTSVKMENLTPDWYRSELDPFFAQRPRKPCFWAWRPDSYSAEVAYAWISGDPDVSNQRANGMMETSFDLEAVA